jgi:hypothetical protein
MANYAERRAKIYKNDRVKFVWFIILIAEIVYIGIVIWSELDMSLLGLGASGMLGAQLIFSALLSITLPVMLLWGTWRIEAGVIWLMIYNVIIGLANFLNFHYFYFEIISIIVLIGYWWIQKQVNTSNAPAPTPK